METYTIELRRPGPGAPWGFRLQGGADFATPLSVQVVQQESIAALAGLCAGDGVLKINGKNADLMEHEQAKEEIIRAGNLVVFTVQRGAVMTWKPKVTPLSELRPTSGPSHISSVTADAPTQKTSLASLRPDPVHIGSSHNRAPKPFGVTLTDDKPTTIVHAQYNSPLSLYSARNVSETFSQQAEAARSNLGINVPNNLSEVEFRAGNRSFVDGSVTSPTGSEGLATAAPPAPDSSSKWCYVCGGFITGVFVKVKGHVLHGDCLRCHRCKISLKNIGYFWVNDNIYCEQHARDITRPPGGGYTAYVIDAPNETQ